MARRGLLGLGAVLWILGASCGEPFVVVGSGGGGAGGTSNNSSSSSSSSSGTTTAPGQEGEPCDPTASAPCEAKLYCETQDCMAGTCKAVPAVDATNHYTPVCGCDGIIYWNRDLAITSSVSFQAGADCNQMMLTPCSKDADPCKGFGEDVYCSLHAIGMTPTVCSKVTGLCTKIPKDCSKTTDMVRDCADALGSCSRHCDMIHDEKTWFNPAVSCP